MSDNVPHSEPAASRPDLLAEARAVEAAAIRRRWITLGEALAVVAVIISGLTLWNSWSERSQGEASKQAEFEQSSRRGATLVLTATAANDHKLALKPTASEQSVQSQTIMFPGALGAALAQTTGAPRIEASWFERALEKARSRAGLPDDSRGDERLPVVITTRFLVDGDAHEDVAVYDIGYTVTGHLLSGHSIRLRGVSLFSHVKRANAQATLEARWKRLFPQK